MILPTEVGPDCGDEAGLVDQLKQAGTAPAGLGPRLGEELGVGAPSGEAGDQPTLIDLYIATQQSLTAVETFARRHDVDALPANARWYQELLPQARPEPGQQYAFEVDLDSCSGCKACVTACRNLNGLDDGESWRAVGLLVGGPQDDPYQQSVTTGCHHCVDPACLSGCPVDAYEKDPLTGIVSHLDDQCIGCRYCMLTCPYDVPQFNKRLGIVRKCDMCTGRLAEGEAPACVQACPTRSIRITVVDQQAVRQAAEEPWPIPATPPPAHTVPTTVFRTTRETPEGALPADHFSVRPADSHTPLAVMLVLTQLAVGAFVIDLLRQVATGNPARAANAVVALAAGLLAIGASLAHLGRPRLAYRAVIGFRHSWISREIVAFGVFAALATLHAGSLLAGARPPAALGTVVALSGVAGVACSAMVYVATRRPSWGPLRVGLTFTLTSAASGLACVLLTSLAAEGDVSGARSLALLLAATAAVKLGWEASRLRHLRDAEMSGARRTAVLLTRHLKLQTLWRFALGVSGGVVIPLVLAAGGPAVSRPAAALAATIALVALTAGELLERSQFFAAATAPRMPGGVE